MKKQYTHNEKRHIKYRNKIAAMFTILGMFVSAPGQVDAAVNLIVNGDLEIPDVSNANLPAGWFMGYPFAGATTTYQYPVAGETGNGAQVTIEGGVSGVDAKWYFAPAPVTSGKEYRFTDNYIATSPTEIVVEFFDAGNQHLSYSGFFSIPVTGPATWSAADVLFTAPANAAFATVFHTIKNGTLVVDNYTLTEVPYTAPVIFDKGIVSFTFDDGWYSQFEQGVPILNAKNIDGSFYIITGAMNQTESGYASSTTLLAAQAQGHELGAHTVSHCNLVTGLCPDGNPPNSVDILSPTQEISNSRSELIGIGAVPVETFVYPYGAFLSPTTTGIVASTGFTGARTTQEGYNNKSSNPYALKTLIIDRAITEGSINVVKDWVDSAMLNHEWLILTFHQIDDVDTIAADNLDGATTPQFFSQIVDYISQKRDADQVVVKTVSEVLNHCMDADESDCINTPLPDISAPVITIDSYNTAPTNQNVVVTAHTNEGTLNETSHTFETNGSFKYIATDTSGNIASTTVTVTNIDKVAPVITVDSHNINPTNQNVLVTVHTDDGTLNATSTLFTVNGSFDFVATDAVGNATTETVSVTNIDKTAPVITIDSYNTAPTNQDVLVTAHTDEGVLNTETHTFTTNGSFSFVATDAVGNSVTETVTVTNIDKIAPVISPAATIIVEATSAAGAVVSYVVPDSTEPITCTPISGSVFALGTTTVSCVATDSALNTSTTTFAVFVRDTVAPVITLTGSNPQGITLGGLYTEEGAIVIDAVDGDISSSIMIDTSAVNVNVAGTYTVSYDVTDAAGNAATTVTRIVQVAQRTLSLTAASATKTYGTTDPLLTYSVTEGALLSGDTFTGTMSRAAGENIGVYAITIGNLTAGSNYALNFTGADFTIIPPTCTKGYVLSANTCIRKPSSSGGGGGGTRVKLPPAKVLGVSSTTVLQKPVTFVFVTTMSVGSRSLEVTELQKRLTIEGVYAGPITGYFGPLTKAAVIRYQALHGIEQVGIVGPKTRAALNK